MSKFKNASLETAINKGAYVTADKPNQTKDWINFTLRIRKERLDQIEGLLNIDLTTKTSWILAAIKEKIQRDE